MVPSFEEELRAGIVVLVVLICLKIVARALTRKRFVWLHRPFTTLLRSCLVLHECSFITGLFRFSETVVPLFDALQKLWSSMGEFFCQGARMRNKLMHSSQEQFAQFDKL